MKIPYKEIFDTIDSVNDFKKKATNVAITTLHFGAFIVLLPIIIPLLPAIKRAVLRKIGGAGW